ncbi:unnamed protein product [Triticum turgidum subsp. durum]|uniref:DUF1618 domain-containing protein n=1 Tax=Triticum turgidum subsp. durum TaxID=4567 RepID=A0A9R1QYE9_TRITD|nr:unnamed protein product [Triticum turgidum subsp. durum]
MAVDLEYMNSDLAVLAAAYHGDCEEDAAKKPSGVVVATETDGGLVLLSVVVRGRSSYDWLRDKPHYFVYNASVPELKHIKQPGDEHPVNEHSFAIVRKPEPDCTYLLAAQADQFVYGNPCHLCLYHPGTDSWSKLLVNVDSVPYVLTTYKAIAIGGDSGLVAWVDLSHMITSCNVLDESPKLRFLRLPTEPQYGSGTPAVRDVSFLNGHIRFVELQHRDYGWKATIWSIKTGVFSKKAWRIHRELDSSDIPESSLPKLKVLREGVTAQPTLSTLDIGLPKRSLQDDCILYLLAKIDYRDRDHTAWVLAVDMKNKAVQRVAEFSPKRSIALSTGYDSSRVSKHFKVGPGGLYHHITQIDSALDDAITALHTLPWTDAIAAPTSITMYSCRTRRPPLDMDDAVATPITTRSCHNITLQLLLASHQLFMMAMASHHRRWHHTDSP